MRDFREQDYYELLDVKPHASQQELETSYQRARRFFSPDSVATYALFQPAELRLLRQRIEEAYRTLSNVERRRSYDREMARLEGTDPLAGDEEQTSLDLPADPSDREDLDAREESGTDAQNQTAEELAQEQSNSEQLENQDSTPDEVASSDSDEPESSKSPNEDSAKDSDADFDEDFDARAKAEPTDSNEKDSNERPEVDLGVDGVDQAVLERSDTPAEEEPQPAAESGQMSREEALEDAMRKTEEPTAKKDSGDAARASDSEKNPEPSDLQETPDAPNTSESVDAAAEGDSTPEEEQSSPPQIDAETEYSGDVIRQVREARGMTLEHIAQVTKISIYYLRMIEQEKYGELPALVYTRGYLRQMAKLLGLEADCVATSYMDRKSRAEE